ncbi:MAG: hypothetical protein SNJ79_04815 [Sphingomonadaceae bacterium]
MRPALLAIAVATAAPAAAAPAIDAIRAEVRAAGAYPFERTRTITDTRGGGTKRVEVDRYDPAKPEGERWTLVSVDGKPPTADQQKAWAKAIADQPIAPGPWRLDPLLSGGEPKVTKNGQETIYAWPRLPKGSLPFGRFDVTGNLAAELSVIEVNGRPTVRQMRVFAPQPFRVLAIARFDVMTVTSDYARDANGRLILTRQETFQDANIPGRGRGQMRVDMAFRPL